MSDEPDKNPPKRRMGRPPHSAGHATRERNRALTNADVKPLQVLLETMAARWNASKEATSPEEREKLRDQACAVARDVAPYFHPKLQATTLKGEGDNPVKFVLDLASSDELRKAVRGE